MIIASISVAYKITRKIPSTDLVRHHIEESFCAESPLITTDCVLSVKYDAIRSTDFSKTPKDL